MHRFIRAERANHSVATLCRVLEVSRAGFYAAERRGPCRRQLEDERIVAQIRKIHSDSRQSYGAPRVHAMLARGGIRVGRKRVARIMKEHGIRAIRGYKAPRNVIGITSTIAPNLLKRQFTVEQPDMAWVTDITYVRTWEGWLYLAVVMDLHSRMIIG